MERGDLGFYCIASTTAAAFLKERLQGELGAGKRVLWLVSGGSNVPITVEALAGLPPSLLPLLTVGLSDERYGVFGHPESNLQKLVDAGLDTKVVRTIAVMDAQPLALGATARRYEDRVRAAVNHADVVLIQLGMGEDGHIAGILPDSPALVASGLVTAYETASYKRITLTLEGLGHASAIYLFAFGDNKKIQLLNLRDRDLPAAEQPAQLLKQLPEVEVYVYNDQIGESI